MTNRIRVATCALALGLLPAQALQAEETTKASATKIISAVTSEKTLRSKPGPVWKPGDKRSKRFCRNAYTAACTDLVQARATVFSGKKKKLGDVEMWIFEYDDAAAASKGEATMSAVHGGDEGIFGKAPQTFRRCGAFVFATRGWFRWHTVRKSLERSLDAAHAAHCKASP